jgi:hypothetical protein
MDVNMPLRKYLQATVRRFLCAAVNIRFMMVRPNKTKPKGYMWPPTVPGGRRHYTHARKDQTSRVRIPPVHFQPKIHHYPCLGVGTGNIILSWG